MRIAQDVANRCNGPQKSAVCPAFRGLAARLASLDLHCGRTIVRVCSETEVSRSELHTFSGE